MKNNKYILGTDTFDGKVFSVCLFDAENNAILISENIVGEKEFEEKVKELDMLVAKKMGFSKSYGVTGQTYPRKLDSIVLNTLSVVAQSAYKFSNDF